MKKLLLLCLVAGSLYGGVSVNPPSKLNGPNGANVDTASGVSINPGSGGAVNVVAGDTYIPTRIDFSTTVSPTLTAAGHAAISFDGTNLKLSLNGGAYTTLGGLSSTDIDTTTEINALTTDDDFPTLAAANLFTNLQSITRSNAQAQTNTITGLGTTTLPGLQLTNTTSAAAGSQQYSPALRWTGQGWKTTATAASQAVDFRAYVVPVQGTANPTAYLAFDASVNGGAFSNLINFFSTGDVTVGTTVNPGLGAGTLKANVSLQSGNTIQTENAFTWRTLGQIYGISDGVWRLTDNAGTSFGRLQLGGTTSSFPAIFKSGAVAGFRQADATIAVFSNLPAAASGNEGAIVPISDSTTITWGATITGGGANHVLAYSNGTNWTVIGK